ncbi:MAG TPA: VOC family protein [Alphaproteobacteria bacterium]|nr:VOC family protein [Alphaproteobacteria bacterium]
MTLAAADAPVLDMQQRLLMRLDHIGIVVPTLGAGRESLSRLFDIRRWTQEFGDEVNRVYVQFGRDPAGVCYELIAPLAKDSPVSAALRKADRILNHVAYITADLEAARAKLSDAGALVLDAPKPAIAYGGRRIQFFFTPLQFIVELVEAPDHVHRF